MKKTLIALMALAGVASATHPVSTTLFNNYLTGIVNDYYVDGSAYTLTINLNRALKDQNGVLLTLADDYYMVNCDNHPASYVGLSQSTAGNSIYSSTGNEISPSFNKTLLTPDTVNNTATWTTASGEYLLSWITTDVQATASSMSSQQKYIDSITIDFDGTSTYLSVVTNGPKLIVNLTDVAINANDIALGTVASSAWGTFTTGGKTYIIPEPATATLSLLALAGLCARRRRA